MPTMHDSILPSWRIGATRTAIIEFLHRADEIPPAERVAVFDNDGTLWCEKPRYTQLDFMMDELRRAVKADPTLGDRAEYRAILSGDRKALTEFGLERVVVSLVDLHRGWTPEEFTARVAAFFGDYRHPDRDVPVRDLRYQPMLELIDEFRAQAFDVYLVTAGGAEFVRVVSLDFYGVKPEGVVGSQIDYELVRDESGALRLRRTSSVIGGTNEGPIKPGSLQRLLGRRPVVAAGNSAGDAEMLEYAQTYDGPSLALLVNHDDSLREYAYESRAETFETSETILETAARLGWVVASIKNDCTTVFAEPEPTR
jgi:phosphoserine phosphatase